MSRKRSPTIAVAIPISIFCAVSIGALVAGPKASFAENVLEFPFPEVVGPAQQASVKLLDAAGATLRALRQAELGDVEGANGQLREATSALGQSKKGFTIVVTQMKERSINYGKAPKEIGGVPIEQILGAFKISTPKTAGDLARIALNEVDTLGKAISDLKFGEKSVSRAGVLRVSNALRRALDVGVVISTLADAAT